MDIFGALLMLRALSLAPVSVIQLVSGCGLAILSVFFHFYLKEVMNVVDWMGITLAGLGTIGVCAGGEEQKASSISILHLLLLACGVAFLFVLLNGWLRIYRRQRREQELMQSEVIEKIIYGLESGILFGIASVFSKMGFLFLEQGFPALLVPVCISISICSSASGLVYQTHGLKHGRAVVVSTCATVASIVTGVLAGMVFLQSLKELGKTLKIINELTCLYGSLAAIPVQVFLAGTCFHIQEDPHGAQKFLEEFLSKWEYVNEQYHVREGVESNESYMRECSNRSVLGVDMYLQVVEAYITLLTGILRQTNHVISWVENASLPKNIRQELSRRLHSMNSSKDTGSQPSTSALLKDGTETSVSLRMEGIKQLDGNDAAKQAILSYSGQNVSTFWWFRKVNIKFGGVRFAVSNGSILLTALILLMYYYMRRKKYTITSILKGQAKFVKKTVIDLWQLAFSYQVNPLAAVETLQTPNRASR